MENVEQENLEETPVEQPVANAKKEKAPLHKLWHTDSETEIEYSTEQELSKALEKIHKDMINKKSV